VALTNRYLAGHMATGDTDQRRHHHLGTPAGSAVGGQRLGRSCGAAAATVALLAWLGPVPTHGLVVAQETRRWRLALVMAVTVVIFFAPGAAGLIVLAPIGVAAAVVLAILRPRPSVRELGFTVALAVLAMAGGLLKWLSSGHPSDVGIAVAQLLW
jgi:hypothetical protein